MTDNIQKLYEIAGVEKRLDCKKCGAENFALGQCAEVNCQATYPPFTAENQLELIKFIIKSWDLILNHKGNRFNLCADTYKTIIGTHISNEQFDQALASLVYELWQDLTDDQKQEIKRILE